MAAIFLNVKDLITVANRTTTALAFFLFQSCMSLADMKLSDFFIA